ncbi:MAG TPA: hypothetical protein VGO59_02680 [Verrucomicrobiae bacterium]|jgi:hypothetical protein
MICPYFWHKQLFTITFQRQRQQANPHHLHCHQNKQQEKRRPKFLPRSYDASVIRFQASLFALLGFLNRSDAVKGVKPCLCTISPWFNWFSSIYGGAPSAWRAAKNRLMPDAQFTRHALILPDFAGKVDKRAALGRTVISKLISCITTKAWYYLSHVALRRMFFRDFRRILSGKIRKNLSRSRQIKGKQGRTSQIAAFPDKMAARRPLPGANQRP